MSVGEVNSATHRALVPPDLRIINSVRERGLLRFNPRMQLQIRVILGIPLSVGQPKMGIEMGIKMAIFSAIVWGVMMDPVIV